MLERQLVGTTEKDGSLSDLKDLGACAEVVSVLTDNDITPAIFLLVDLLELLDATL